MISWPLWQTSDSRSGNSFKLNELRVIAFGRGCPGRDHKQKQLGGKCIKYRVEPKRATWEVTSTVSALSRNVTTSCSEQFQKLIFF